MAQFMAAAGSGDGVKQRQVVSLGAGFDTTWLHMKARHARGRAWPLEFGLQAN